MTAPETSIGSGMMGRRWGDLAAVLIASFVCITLVLAIHATNPRTLVSTHGLLHAAIIQQCDRGVPPENPFFTGRPVCYYWFIHWMAAGYARLTGLDPFHAFEHLIVASFVPLFAFAVRLGRRLLNSAAAGLCIAWLALVGANPLGPLVYLYRCWSRGQSLLDNAPDAPFGPYMYDSAQVGARLYGPNLPFFIHITSRPIALAMLLGMASCCLSLMARSGSSNGDAASRSERHFSTSVIGLALLTTLCTAVNPLIGLASAAALGAGLIGASLWRRIAPDDACRPRVLPLLIALSLGVALAAPTFLTILQYRQGGARFALSSGVGFMYARAVAVGAGPMLIAAIAGLRRFSRSHRPFVATMLLAACVLLTLSIAFQLPVENNHNFFNAAMVFLAVPAAGLVMPPSKEASGSPVVARVASPTRILWLAACCLPAALLIVRSYSGRAPIDADFAGERIVRTPGDSDLARLYEWIDANTESNAVFITDPRRKIAVEGNMQEFPAMTRRVLFIGNDGYMTDPYPDAAQRRRIATRLLSGERLLPEDDAALAELTQPVYVVLQSDNDSSGASLISQRLGPARFRAATVFVWQWRAAARDKVEGNRAQPN